MTILNGAQGGAAPPATPPSEPDLAAVFREAQGKLADGSLPIPKLPGGEPPVSLEPPEPPPAPAPPPETPPDPQRQEVLKQIEESAAARLQRERQEFEAAQARFAEQQQAWQQRLEQEQPSLREAADLRAWKAQQAQLARTDLYTYLKGIGLNDDDAMAGIKSVWHGIDGEGSPPQVKQDIAAIKMQSENKALQSRLDTLELMFRQYAYHQQIDQAATPLLSQHPLTDGARREAPQRYQTEVTQAVNYLMPALGRMPTANEILGHVEKRLTQERDFYSRIVGKPAASTPAPVQQAQQTAIEVPAATALSASAPQRQPTPDLPDDDRTAWRMAVAEAQAKFPG